MVFTYTSGTYPTGQMATTILEPSLIFKLALNIEMREYIIKFAPVIYIMGAVI